MALSITQTPANVSPAQSPIVFTVNETGGVLLSSSFQYYADLYYWDGLPNQSGSVDYLLVKYPNQSFSIALQYAPDGAKYGKFVEEGTSKMDARPFAESAANDPLLKRSIDNAIKGVIDTNIMPVIQIGLNRAFKRMQTKK